MSCELLTLSLDRLEPSDWAYFELLCSKYLTSEFNNLRTMAAANGDGGRDSELFCPENDPNIVIQYSVTKSWRNKISLTKNRLAKEFPNSKYLIFLSNQQIGANSDDLKIEFRKDGYFLDVRDKNWFIERQFKSNITEKASEALIKVIAIPYLEGEKIIHQRRPYLTTEESKIALTYLSLQWEDESTEKGLTKIAFEALVLAALKNTNSVNRMSKDELHGKVYKMVPSSNSMEIDIYIDSAINKLKKKRIRHWIKENEFCLTFEESEKVISKLAIQELDEKKLEEYVHQLLESIINEYNELSQDDIEWLSKEILKVLDTFLANSGEQFARGVASGEIVYVDSENIKDYVVSVINEGFSKKSVLHIFPEIAISVIKSILHSKNERIRLLLKKVADSYTLYSFLRETPDVQSVTKKLFSHGNIWLDTTIILPLLSETLNDNDKSSRYSSMIKTLSESGVKFYVTEGVIDEVLHHIQNSVFCSSKSSANWIGRIPFLYSQYLENGNNPEGFSNWAELFRGNENPEYDFEEYLKEEWSIELKSLAKESEKIENELRFSIQRLWEEAHARRRKNIINPIDEITTAQLVRNDVESYLGILALRKGETSNEVGSQNWWLTIDSIAWKIRDSIKNEFKSKTPHSPLMSLDFLLNSFSFGPSRFKLDRQKEQQLPIFFDFALAEFMPIEILEVAEKTRLEYIDLPEHVIKRKVRDACNKLKRHCGVITKSKISTANN